MQKNSISILSTAPVREEMILMAAGKDIRLEIIPFIEVKPIHNQDIQDRIHAYSKQKQFIIFTSEQAVEYVFQKIQPQIPDWKIACIAGKTEKKLIDYFGQDRIIAVADNASRLAMKILDLNIQQALFFCGNLRREELPEILKEGNVELTELIVYETNLTPVRVSKRYDGILFFSPSAIKSFFTVNTLPSKTILFTIGQTTKASLMNLTQHKIISIDKPNKEDLVHLALQYFETPMIH